MNGYAKQQKILVPFGHWLKCKGCGHKIARAKCHVVASDMASAIVFGQEFTACPSCNEPIDQLAMTVDDQQLKDDVKLGLYAAVRRGWEMRKALGL